VPATSKGADAQTSRLSTVSTARRLRSRPMRRICVAVVVLLVAAVALSAAGAGSAAPGSGFTPVAAVSLNEFPTVQAVRSSDGNLHLVWATGATGVATRTITGGGSIGPQIQAFNGFGVPVPGIVQLENGQLEILFGGTRPQNNYSSLFGVSSSAAGTSWSAPEVDVAAAPGTNDEGTLWVAHVLAVRSGSTPVLVLSIGGSITVQEGLGQGSPYNASVLNSSDNFAGGVDVALDAGSQGVVASWVTGAQHTTVLMQQVWPSLGALQKMPGQFRNELVLAGRDSGPGVYGAYTADGTHVRLVRYGGGSVPVGSLAGVAANIMGVATGPDGRVWVMWGSESGGVAVTRSNKAVTRFEPIQHINPHAGSLYRLWGDGRLGPLDLFVDMVPATGQSPSGTFYSRIIPELSAKTSVKAVTKKTGTVHHLTVHVSDAGDHVSGATVSAGGKSGKTTGAGVVTLTLPASVSGVITVKVKAPGYRPLAIKVKV
jgi:hypothetical protein